MFGLHDPGPGSLSYGLLRSLRCWRCLLWIIQVCVCRRVSTCSVACSSFVEAAVVALAGFSSGS